MRIRHRGLLIGGALLVAACSSGGETEPLPLETAPPVTSPTTDATTASTETADSIEPVEETTTSAVPESTTTEAPDQGDPVQVFREAAAAFNEVQLNPEDESIQPAAYELMTERFRADRSFEVRTGDPAFLDPFSELVLLSEAELGDDGASAKMWYCVRLAELSGDSSDPISRVQRATMEMVDGSWRWAARATVASSPQSQGCPADLDRDALVDEELRGAVEAAAIAFVENSEAALQNPTDEETVRRFTDGLTGRPLESLGGFVDSLASEGRAMVVDASSTAGPLLVSSPVLSPDGTIFAVVCEPLVSRIEAVGSAESDLFLRRTTVIGLRFVREGTDLLVGETTTVSDLEEVAECDPSL